MSSSTMFAKKSQYSSDVIRQFEFTFGKNYMSAGGQETTIITAELLEPVLSKTKSPSVLDVGCGIGGSAFYFASEFNANVHGVDIEQGVIDMGNEELKKHPLPKGSCKLEAGDIVAMDFPENSFDIIVSRDAMVHLNESQKIKLFQKFQTWLKPNGMVCICDYCLGPKPKTEAFQKYLDQRGYHMVTPPDYKKLFVEHAGFQDEAVVSRDKQLWYCQICQKEVDRVIVPGPTQDEFLKTKTQEDLEKFAKVYRDKITMSLRGDRSYVMLTATKQPSYLSLRQQVVDTYRKMSETSLIFSCDGNVSCRVPDGFLVTPSGVNIPDLTAAKVVLCDVGTGHAKAGESFKPSSESKGLHNAIYKARPDVGAIVHSHSIYACALACCQLPLPPAHYAVCELIQQVDFSNPNGGSTMPFLDQLSIQCAPYHTYGTKAVGEATLKALGNNHAALMANHGAVVVGPDLETAMYNAERLERECEIYWRSLQMQSVGAPKPLQWKDVQDLQKADATYGQEFPDADEEE